MTVWPVRAAAAIVLGLAFSPIVASAPSAQAAGQPVPVSVTMIATLTVPERTTAFIDPTLLESYTAPFGLLTRELDQVINRPIAIGIDPSIIASIRVLGSLAPDSSIAWLERLDAATNETFPLAWADADLTLGLQAGSGDVLIPEAYDYAIDPALFSAQQAEPTPTPEGTEEPVEGEEPPLPTNESLVEWDYTVPEITWPTMNAVAGTDLAKLGDYYGTTILSSGNIGQTTWAAAHTLVNDEETLVADEALSAEFGLTVEAFSGGDWDAAIAGLTTAVSGVASTDDKPASVLIALGREVSLADPDLGPTIDALGAAASVDVIGLAELLATPLSTATLVDKVHGEEQVAGVKSMLTEERADRAFAVIAENPSLITSQRRLELMATLSNSWSNDTVGWTTAVSEYRATSEALRNKVRIIKSSSITLWADKASLPVTITNELTQPVTVYVTVRPLTPLLKIEDGFVAVTVEPQSQRKASVPVQSLSNGIVELEITLHTDKGKDIGDLTYVKTTVQAGWETPVTWGFGIAVLAVFVAGILRTIVRRRRARTSED